jgi:hypothetical protein
MQECRMPPVLYQVCESSLSTLTLRQDGRALILTASLPHFSPAFSTFRSRLRRGVITVGLNRKDEIEHESNDGKNTADDSEYEAIRYM